MIDKQDCFRYMPYGNKGKCTVLNVTTCKKCSFYKTKEQFQEDLEKYPPDPTKFTQKKR